MVDGIGGPIRACNLPGVVHADKNPRGTGREVIGGVGAARTPNEAVFDTRGIGKDTGNLTRSIDGGRTGCGGAGRVQIGDRPGGTSQEAMPRASRVRPYADNLAR